MTYILTYPMEDQYASFDPQQAPTIADPVNALFSGAPKEAAISTVVIRALSKSYTLLLVDGVGCLPFTHSVDTLSEISPVTVDCAIQRCSAKIQQAIQEKGKKVKGSPTICAFEITFNETAEELGPSVVNEGALLELMYETAPLIKIEKYIVTKIKDTWDPPQTNPDWRGIKFEQSDQAIRAWIHEPNSNAQATALKEAENALIAATKARSAKGNEISAATQKGTYEGEVKKRLDAELSSIAIGIEEQESLLDYLGKVKVNSATQTTFQCLVMEKVTDQEKIDLLRRFVSERIVTLIDTTLNGEWARLNLNRIEIESFISQKYKSLKSKVDFLLQKEDGGEKMERSWIYFKNNRIAKQNERMKLLFEDFSQGEFTPPKTALVEWNKVLEKRFKWITDSLRCADDELKRLKDFSFLGKDINIWNQHKQILLKAVPRENPLDYRLNLELKVLERERNFLGDPRQHKGSVLLVKRITTTGKVCYGVTSLESSGGDEGDPNSNLNAVHIPFSAEVIE